MSKRYLLYMSSADLTQTDFEAIEEVVENRYGCVKAIPIKGNPRAVILKTSSVVATLLRGEEAGLKLGDKVLVSVLTSGAIGNLKRRAPGTPANGKIS